MISMNNPKPDHPVAPIRAEMREWNVGQRVMVRVNLPADSSHLYSDVLGYITALDGEFLTLETRQGPRRIALESVAIGKIIPPPPPRRARRIIAD